VTPKHSRAVLLRELCANDNVASDPESPMVSLPSLDDPAIRQRFVRALAELIADAMLRPHGPTK
jgi:hypothetical protein